MANGFGDVKPIAQLREQIVGRVGATVEVEITSRWVRAARQPARGVARWFEAQAV